MTFTMVRAGIGKREIWSASLRWRNINISMPILTYPALLLSSMPSAGVALGLGGIEQLEDAPEYADTQRGEG